MINVRGLPYFAYGSNLAHDDFDFRCPGAKPLKRAKLTDWRLTFRGVADIEPRSGFVVEGALWKVSDEDIRALDRYEGAPQLYDRAIVTVETTVGKVKAFTYVMVSHLTIGLPSPYYYGVIERGYRDFGINIKSLEDALDRVSRAHDDKGVSHYVPQGNKRLVAVLESELEETRLDEIGIDYSAMTPATRMYYELEA